ncbi:hypothetical protein WN944_008861 [Citrus x changshan-huyou]|uniref:Uncharacterized protein n=1 Tax=Citrus x changshan-huyou TaxID=2935761 RepID=A0AAP0MR37_9ROSI
MSLGWQTAESLNKPKTLERPALINDNELGRHYSNFNLKGDVKLGTATIIKIDENVGGYWLTLTTYNLS